ncbi:MAG: pantetheine-phosphate adenylyltransferase [Alphaproteobacteria bacterium]|nr:pantetheine-phosphate adenylyltransferase [Alphaproteobacteria bacterium]
MSRRVGVYPGTFDPVTDGHMDIIKRATSICDHLIVGCANNIGKSPLFSLEERTAMVKEEIEALGPERASRIEVVAFETLLIEFAGSVGASFIIRGLRAVSDFEYEFQMVGMNSRLNPEIETVFLMASETVHFISSRFVREIGGLGGDVSKFVSPRTVARLKHRFAEKNRAPAKGD